MSQHQHTVGKRRIVCEMNASAESRVVVEAAIAHCREHDAEVVVVWVVNPIELRSPAAAGMPGTWGLIGAHGLMVERLRDEGIVIGTSFRIGDPSRVLEEERVAFGAERIFFAADVPVRRCPACGARVDSRAVHFCPAVHRADARAA